MNEDMSSQAGFDLHLLGSQATALALPATTCPWPRVEGSGWEPQRGQSLPSRAEWFFSRNTVMMTHSPENSDVLKHTSVSSSRDRDVGLTDLSGGTMLGTGRGRVRTREHDVVLA